MKLNLTASDVAESLKQRTSEDSASTNLSSLINRLDIALGKVLAICEDEDATHMIAEDYMGSALDIYDKLLKARYGVGTNFYEQPLDY